MFLQDGSREFRSRSFWTEVIAEFLATLLFLFMVCGTVLPWNHTLPSVMHIAFSHGLSIATLAMAVQHISGGQLNPAVTIAMMSVGRVSVLKAVFFVGAQCLGGRLHKLVPFINAIVLINFSSYHGSFIKWMTTIDHKAAFFIVLSGWSHSMVPIVTPTFRQQNYSSTVRTEVR